MLGGFLLPQLPVVTFDPPSLSSGSTLVTFDASFAFAAFSAGFLAALLSAIFAIFVAVALRAFLAVAAVGRSRFAAPRDAAFLRMLSALLSINSV